MPRSFATKTRQPKPPVPLKEQWEKFPLAVMGKDWKRAPNPQALRTNGHGYACLLLTHDSCGHFVKKCSFQDHMRSVHRLNPTPCPIGRPKTSTRHRNPPTPAARAHNRESTNGSWPARLWKAKKARMSWLLRQAYNATAAQSGDPVKWSIQKAKERYDTWRESTEFQDLCLSLVSNTMDWWRKNVPNIDLEVLHAKSKVPEDLEEWSSDDGCPEVDISASNFAELDFRFKPRVVTKREEQIDVGNKPPGTFHNANTTRGKEFASSSRLLTKEEDIDLPMKPPGTVNTTDTTKGKKIATSSGFRKTEASSSDLVLLFSWPCKGHKI